MIAYASIVTYKSNKYFKVSIPEKNISVLSYAPKIAKKLVKVKNISSDGMWTIDTLYEGQGIIEEYYDVADTFKDLSISKDILKQIREVRIVGE